MTAREYLEQVQVIDKQINQKLKKAQMLRQSPYGQGISYESTGKKNGYCANAFEKTVAKVVDYEQEANVLIDCLIEKRLEIEKAIAAIPDDKQREVLEHKYLYFQDWDQISAEMGYSKSHLYELHRMGLEKITF